mmetsp:Transcript_2970/g.5405  ORF Transcript_2970/g.5405 Transcript_2970/m.5405 type:complete len:92 (+) Transcript_2970:295-570(+)
MMKSYDSISVDVIEKESLVAGSLTNKQQCPNKEDDDCIPSVVRSNLYLSGYILMGVLFFGVALGFSFGFLAGIQYWKQISEDTLDDDDNNI